METGLGRICSVTEWNRSLLALSGGMATIWRATFPFCARKIGLLFYEWKTDA